MAGGKNFSILADVELDTKSIQKQLDKIKLKFQVDDKGLKNVTASIKDVGKSAEQASKGMKALSDTTDSAVQNAESLVVSYQVANAIMRESIKLIGAMAEQVFELDRAQTEFKKVSDLSGDALDKYTNKLAKMGQITGRTASEMVDAATQFKKSGFSEEDSANLGLTATLFQNIADEAISAGEASSFIISQIKAFGLEATDASYVVDALNEISNRFSVSSSDLSENIGKASAALATGNNTYSESLAMLTAITEITQSASRGARGLTSIQSRFTQILDEQSSTGKALLEIYEGLGIEVFDQTGQIRSLYDVMSDLAKIWPELSTNQKDYIALTQAGSNQSQNFLALLSNFDTAIEANTVALNSNGSALKENEAFTESLEFKVQALKATFQDLATNVIENELIKSLLDLANKGLSMLNTEFGQIITQIGLATGAVGGLIALVKASHVIEGVVSSLKAFGAILGGTATGLGALASAALPVAAILATLGVAAWGLYKEYKEGNPSLEEANEKLATNASRLEEINKIPWYDRTPEISKEKLALEENNKELEKQLGLLDEKRKKDFSKRKLVFTKVSYGAGSAYDYYTNDWETAAEAAQDYIKVVKGVEVSLEDAQKAIDDGTVRIAKNVDTMKYAGDELDKFIEEELVKFQEEIKGQNELTDTQIIKWGWLSEQANNLNDEYIAVTGSAAPFNDILIEINKQLSEAEQATMAAGDAFIVTSDEAERLKASNESLAGAIEDNNGVLTINAEKLFNVQGQTAQTNQALSNLIATETIFNNSEINVSNKISQLYSLAKAAHATGQMFEMLQAYATGDIHQQRGVTQTLRYKYGTADWDKLLDIVWGNIEYQDTPIPSAPPTYTPSTTTTAPSKTSRPTKDPNLTAFESSYKDLKHRYDMGEIAAEEYYNQLEQLIAQYMATEKADAQEMYKYQEEIYEGRKKLEEELTKKQDEEAKKRAEQEKEALEKQKEAYEAYADFMVDNINKQLDEYRQQREDIIKKYDDEIDKLEEVNDETERNIELGERQEAVAKAKQKQLLVYKDGRYQYIQDSDAVSEAQAELDAYNREQALRQEVERIEQLKNDEVKKIDELIIEWEKYRDEWSDLAGDYKRSQDKLLIEQQLGIDTEKDNWTTRLANVKEFVAQYNATLSQLNAIEGTSSAGAGGGGSGYQSGSSTLNDYFAFSGKPNWSELWHTVNNDPTITDDKKNELLTEIHNEKVKEMEGSGQTYHPASGSWYAKGTTSAYGGISLVGEEGPELRVLGTGDGIIPADVTKNLWSWGMTNPASMMAAIEGGSTIANKSMSVLIENLNLPEVHDGNDFVQYMKNNFWSKTLQFATR